MGDSPTISVLMPAFNAEKYIRTAVESILNQTFSDFEFLIIDDGSVDSTWEIIKVYAQKDSRIKLLRNQSNLGICETLNRGLRFAKGKYLARMDADDWSFPERLELQIAFMEANPKVVICGGNIKVCDENLKLLNKREYPQRDNQIRASIFRLNPFAHPTVMFRTEAVKKAGGYNPKLADVEDYDLYFRLGKFGQFANLSQTLLKLRTHPSSISSRTISRQTRLNLYIRLKAVGEYGYKMSLKDKIFFGLNLMGALLIPEKLKFQVYNFLRKS